MSDSSIVSPRVNSARLASYVGRTVRLTCKVIKFKDNVAIVEASDGGQVEIKLGNDANSEIRDSYIEAIGQVLEPGVMKMLACLNLGNEFDLKIADFVVEKWHSAQFESVF